MCVCSVYCVLLYFPAPRIYQEFKSTDQKYKSRLRSRISNLKDQKNPDLRRNVLAGNISADRIANMAAEVRKEGGGVCVCLFHVLAVNSIQLKYVLRLTLKQTKNSMFV